MRCPFCGFIDQKVLDSRPARDGEAIRRRRECSGCGRRFTTFEEPERPRLFVIKRDGSRSEFDRDKTLRSMLIATRKRRIPIEDLKEAVERIERDLHHCFEEEVPTHEIGERVLGELWKIDTVAYIRFASVYREFETVKDFEEMLQGMKGGVGLLAGEGCSVLGVGCSVGETTT
jgi:transcriptional repressor NrdR